MHIFTKMITKMSFFTGYSLEEHLNYSGKPFHTEKFNFRILILLQNPSLNFFSKVHTKNSDINFSHRVRYHDFSVVSNK